MDWQLTSSATGRLATSTVDVPDSVIDRLSSICRVTTDEEVLGQAGQFAINILSSSQEALSRRFAGNTSGRFDGIGYRIEDGYVLLDGALATVTCEAHASFEAGDHNIYVGRVVRGSVAPGRPLLYYRRGYVTAGVP